MKTLTIEQARERVGTHKIAFWVNGHYAVFCKGGELFRSMIDLRGNITCVDAPKWMRM